MVTGDNLLTALSVARECGMINPADNVILAHTQLPDDVIDKPSLTFTYSVDDRLVIDDLGVVTR